MDILNDLSKRFLVTASTGFISGLILSYYLKPSALIYCLVFLSAFVLILLICLIQKRIQKKRYPKIFTLSLLFAVPLIFGILRLALCNYSALKDLKSYENDNALYFAKITSEPEKIPHSEYLVSDATVFKITNNARSKETNINISLYYHEDSGDIGFNDTVSFYTAYTSDKTDFAYLMSKDKTFSVFSDYIIKSDEKPPKNFLSDFGVNLKGKILDATDRVYSYNPESAAIIKAILTGEKGGLSQNTYNRLSQAGFLHVAAISGTHVSILFAFLSLILYSLQLNKKVVFIISVPIIIIFSAVAAFTPSVLRAAIMLIISILALFLNKEYDPLTSLMFSALVILIVFPYALFTAGFLLSFGAAGGIILFGKHFERFFRNTFGKFYMPFLCGAISVSVSAFIGTAPFTLWYFETVSLWSIITNIWIIPLVYAIFCLGLVSAAFFFILPEISLFIVRTFTEPLVFLLLKTAEVFSGLKSGIITPAYIPWGIYLYLAAFLTILKIYLKKYQKIYV